MRLLQPLTGEIPEEYFKTGFNVVDWAASPIWVAGFRRTRGPVHYKA